jgi:glycosyltransferase involved in cell wall biosynthesis
MRILLVSHPPLSAQHGAAQVALNLAAALAARGHDARAWSPEPLPARTRWWDLWRQQRLALEQYVAAEGPFDAIDLPAVSLSRRLGHAALTVARSTQPELLYQVHSIRSQLRRGSGVSLPRALAHAAHGVVIAAALLAGWRRAHLILCQGDLELAWMRRRFPWWRGKLRRWAPAPPPEEQAALAGVRTRRRPPAPDAGLRFLWLGRWVAHKGTDRLLAFARERAALRPRDSLTLAGCGPAALRDCPAGLVASGWIRIVPAYSREELPALLAEHDAGLFTSEVEGWGLTLQEMLESGLPVFATPAGGVEDLRRFWGGLLLPFPPPLDPRLPAAAEPSGDLSELGWPAIAERYEKDVLAIAGGTGPCIRS